MNLKLNHYDSVSQLSFMVLLDEAVKELRAKMQGDLTNFGVTYEPTLDERLVPTTRAQCGAQLISLRGVLMVSDNNHSGVLWGNDTNVMFRAWHDWQHSVHHKEFTPPDELWLGLDHLKRLKLNPASLAYDLMLMNGVGQTVYQLVNGKFPDNQGDWERRCLRAGRVVV